MYTINVLLMLIRRIISFYADGFRRMTLGRTLWGIILLKLLLLFVVMRLIFFTPALQGSDGEKSDRVSSELTSRAHSIH